MHRQDALIFFLSDISNILLILNEHITYKKDAQRISIASSRKGCFDHVKHNVFGECLMHKQDALIMPNVFDFFFFLSSTKISHAREIL